MHFMGWRCYPKINVKVVAVSSIIFLLLVSIISLVINSQSEISKQILKNPITKKYADHSEKSTDPGSRRYGVIIDCGSSGSRVFLYFWPKHSGNPHDLLNITPLRDHKSNALNLKIEPGLSETDMSVSDYMAPLLKFALKHIPKNYHSTTVLYVLATAGMRLLPERLQNKIMTELREKIPTRYPFVASNDHFEVISGKQEGVYMWLAINYVLHRFDHSATSVELSGKGAKHAHQNTVAILDMGGASMQIAFEVPPSIKSAILQDDIKHLMADVNIGCKLSDLEHSYRVYVATFLGMGANSARLRYEDMLRKNASFDRYQNYGKAIDPCLPKGMTTLSLIPSNNQSKKKENLYFVGSGDFYKCRSAIKTFLNTSTPCTHKPCTLNGVYQPELNFSAVETYGFSEFWYTTDDILGIGGLYEPLKFEKAAHEYCQTNGSTLNFRHKHKFYPKASKSRLRLQCFKSAWLSAVLHDGFNVPLSYKHMHTVKHVNKQPVQWTLGALLHRTRFLPLQEIESFQFSHNPAPHTSFIEVPPYLSSFIFMSCIVIVIVFIVLYLRHLRSSSLKQTLGLHRVPSVPYFTA